MPGTPYSVVSTKSGETYYLHSREVKLRGGRPQKIFFFARNVREGVLDTLPEGFTVTQNARTGMPMLKSLTPKPAKATKK